MALVTRHWLALLCLLGSTYFIAFPPYAPWPAIRSDGYGYHLWVKHILTGDLSFCSERSFTNRVYGVFANSITPPSAEGRCAIIYPAGVALAKVPFLVAGANLEPGGEPTEYEQFVTILLPILMLAGILAMLDNVLARNGIGPVARKASLAAITLGTGLYHYAVFDGEFSHIYSAFWVTVVLWAAVREPRLARVLVSSARSC